MVGKVDFVLGGDFEFVAWVEEAVSNDGFGFAEDFDVDFEAEGNSEVALLGAGFLNELVAVEVAGEVELDGGDVFLGVEVEDEVFKGEDFFADNDALAFVEAAEFSGAYLAAAGEDGAGTEVLDEDEVEEAEGDDGVLVFVGGDVDVAGIGGG